MDTQYLLKHAEDLSYKLNSSEQVINDCLIYDSEQNLEGTNINDKLLSMTEKLSHLSIAHKNDQEDNARIVSLCDKILTYL